MNSALDRAWEKKQEAKQQARAFLCAFRAGLSSASPGSRAPRQSRPRRCRVIPDLAVPVAVEVPDAMRVSRTMCERVNRRASRWLEERACGRGPSGVPSAFAVRPFTPAERQARIAERAAGARRPASYYIRSVIGRRSAERARALANVRGVTWA